MFCIIYRIIDSDFVVSQSNTFVCWQTRAGKSKSLIRRKRLKAGKGGKGKFDLQLEFWQKKVPH